MVLTGDWKIFTFLPCVPCMTPPLSVLFFSFYFSLMKDYDILLYCLCSFLYEPLYGCGMLNRKRKKTFNMSQSFHTVECQSLRNIQIRF